MAFDGLKLPHRIAVGWSGGADSTALLLTLKRDGHEVVAWHVDHGWHRYSQAQAGILRQQAIAWGIPFYSTTIMPSTNNREAEARSGRYRQFHLWADEQKLYNLALGHHMDDQAETVFLRLIQGAGIAGCCGMRSKRKVKKLTLFRPLLHTSRLDITSELKQAGIGWVQDPSNQDMTLLRNRIRHCIFPSIQCAGSDPRELFLRWQRCAELLHREISSLADHVPISKKDTDVSVIWSKWQSQLKPVRAMIIQRMMMHLFGEGTVAGKRHIQLVETWRSQGAINGLDLSRSRLWRRGKYLNLSESRLPFSRSD